MPGQLSGCAILFLALLVPARAAAADGVVSVACPNLSGEQAAEVESRIRASLLTLGLAANVAVDCAAELALVKVDASGDKLELEAAVSRATAQDDLVSAADRAIEQLLRRRAQADAPAASASSQAPPAAPLPSPAPPFEPTPARSALASPDGVTVNELPRQDSATELGVLALGEWWQDQVALGGGLAVARRSHSLWYGLRGGVLVPLGSDSSFHALEAHASLELGWQPNWAMGVRLALGLGPSLLFAAPSSGLMSRGDRTAAALFAELGLSRAFRLGALELMPSVGARLFTSERGVRVDQEQRLRLVGLAPNLELAVNYVLD